MKKITLFLLCLLLITEFTSAQGIYFRFGGGYALPIATQTIGTKELQMYDNSGTTSYTSEVITASFGAGILVNLGAGYMFNKNIGVDLAFQYQKGKEYKTQDLFYQTTPGNEGRSEEITTYQSQGIFIIPSFIVTTGTGSKTPYGKFGVVVGSPKITREEYSFYDLDGTEERTEKWEYKKGTALGFQGTVGMNWMLSNNIDLYTEITFISMSHCPNEAELKKLTVNGDDRLPDATVWQKKVEFKKEIDLTQQFDADKPRQELRESTPFSSVSFQVGVRYLLKGHSID